MLRSGEITAWLESQLGPYPFSTTGGLVTGPRRSGSRWRTRPVRPTRVARARARCRSSCTSWRTSGSATRSRSRAGATSGSTRASRTFLRALLRRDPRWQSDPGLADRDLRPLPAVRRASGSCASTTPAAGTCSTSRSTTAARWPSRRCGTGSARPRSGSCCAPGSTTRRYGNGSVADFQALAESVSGQDLDGFFDAWLHARIAAGADRGERAGLTGAQRSRIDRQVTQPSSFSYSLMSTATTRSPRDSNSSWVLRRGRRHEHGLARRAARRGRRPPRARRGTSGTPPGRRRAARGRSRCRRGAR